MMETITQPVDFTDGIPQSSEFDTSAVFGENPWDIDEREYSAQVGEWQAKQTAKLDQAALDPDAFYAGDDLSFAPDTKTAQRMATNDAFLSLHSGGGDVPLGDLDRKLLRLTMAERFFEGRGANSEEEFHAEIVRDATRRKDTKALGQKLTEAAFDDAMLPRDKAPGYGTFRESLKTLPGYDPAMEADYLEAWNESRRVASERVDAYREPLTAIWRVFKMDGNITATAYDAWSKIPEDQRGEFLEALAIRAKALPDDERKTFWANMAKQTELAVSDYGRNAAESAVNLALSTDYRAGSPAGVSIPVPEGQSAQSLKESQTRQSKEFQQRRNFAADVRRIAREDYDPLKSAFADGKPGFWENAAYQTPGVTGISMTMAVPVVGMATMALSMEGQAYETLRGRMMAEGMADAEATQYAQSLAPFVAAPQAALEKVGFGIWARKVPAFSKVMDSLGDRITNRVLRGAAKTATIAVAETGVETLQDLTSFAVQDIAAALTEDVPDVAWGKVLGESWANAPEILATMLPLAILGAAGGLSAESRTAAFAQSTPLERRALGITAEASAAIDAAQGPASLKTAVDAAWESRDPNSPEALAAIDEQKAAIATQAKAAADLQRIGYVAPRFVQTAEGITVLDGQTGEELGQAPDLSGAIRIARAHTVALDDMEADQVAALGSLMEAARAATELDPSSAVDIGFGETFDPEMAARFAAQVALKEQAEGGSGDIARSVLGYSMTSFAQGMRTTINKLFRGAAVTDVFHETFHGMRRQALAAGTLTRADEIAVLRALDTVLAGKRTKDGTALRFIGDGITDEHLTSGTVPLELIPSDFKGTPAQYADTLLDEAISEIAEMELLRTRKGKGKGKFGVTRGVISRNLTAMAKLAPGAVKTFKSFIDAVRARWGLSLSRAIALKKAERDGKFDAAGYDAFLNKLLGLDAQEEHDAGVRSELARIIGAVNVPAFTAQEAAQAKADGFTYGPVYHFGGPNITYFDITRADPEARLGKGFYFVEAGKTALEALRMVSRPSTGGMYLEDIIVQGEEATLKDIIEAGSLTVAYLKNPQIDGREAFVTSKDQIRLPQTKASIAQELDRILALPEDMADDDISFSIGRGSNERLDASGNPQGIDTNTPGGANIGDAALPGNSAVTPEMDAAYLDAVEKDDLNAAQEILDQVVASRIIGANFPILPTTDPEKIHKWLHENIGEDEDVAVGLRAIYKPEFNEAILPNSFYRNESSEILDELSGTSTYQLEPNWEYREEKYTAKFITKALKEANSAGAGDMDVMAIAKGRLEVDEIFADAHEIVISNAEVIAYIPRRLKIKKDSSGNVIPLSQRFNQSPPASSGAFSLGPAQVADIMAGDALKRITDPRRRTHAMQRIAADFNAMRLQIDRLLALTGRRMSKTELRQQANAREDLRAEELIGDIHRRFGSLAFDAELTKLKSMPVHAYLSDPTTPLRGTLMSKAAAIKAHPDQYQLHREGHYDGSDGVSRSIFGGNTHPADAAQNLYDEALISEPTADAMWEALLQEQRTVAANKEALVKMQEQIREAKAEAKAEATEWLNTQAKDQETNFNPREEIIRSLRMLDAILLAMPPEVRGKVGGYTQMARITTNEAKLSFLRDKLKKADAELETFLREEFGKEFEALMKRAAPATNKPGERPSGSIDPDAYEIFRIADQFSRVKFAEAEAEATKYDTLAEHEDTDPMEAGKFRAIAQVIRLVQNWTGADAARREQAVLELESIYHGGLMALRKTLSARNERLAKLRDSALAGTGKTGHRMEREAAKKQSGKLAWEFLSFGQLVNVIFGEDSAAARWFNAREIAASNALEDAMQAKVNAMESMFETLASSRFAGEKLRHRMQTVKSITVTDALGKEQTFTDSEAITFLLMWRQADGQRHMQGQTDDEGNILSDWAWTQQAADAVESQLSKEGKGMLAFLGDSYGEEYGRINDVFRRIWNVAMPRHKMYAPLTVKASQAKADTIMDPVSGDTMGIGMTPDSLKNRSQTAVAEPDFRDAFQVYLTHARQMEHFIAYGEFARDALAITNRRDTRNAIEANGGSIAMNTLGRWIDFYAMGGIRDANMGSEWMQRVGRALGRLSQAELVGRVSVLAMQSLQLAAAAYKMPLGAYLSRFAKLQAGRLDWGDAVRSPYIQRRIGEMPPIVRDLIKGLEAGAPNHLKFNAAKLARTIPGADALFTAGTYAIFYDYHLQAAKASGAANPEAIAHAEAERLTDQVAQPTRSGARSMIELANSGNPAFRALWNFCSDPRQKASIAVYEMMRRDKKGGEKAAAASKAILLTWGVSGILQAVVRAILRDMRSDEDDEVFDERHWRLDRLGLQALTGPLGALPFFGSMAEAAVYKATGTFMPEGTLLSALGDAAGLVPKWLDGDIDAMKDAESLFTAGSVFSSTSAAAASGMHVVRDAWNTFENFTD